MAKRLEPWQRQPEEPAEYYRMFLQALHELRPPRRLKRFEKIYPDIIAVSEEWAWSYRFLQWDVSHGKVKLSRCYASPEEVVGALGKLTRIELEKLLYFSATATHPVLRPSQLAKIMKLAMAGVEETESTEQRPTTFDLARLDPEELLMMKALMLKACGGSPP